MNRVETPCLQIILSSNSPYRLSHYGSEEPRWRGFVFEQNQSPSITVGGKVVKIAFVLQEVAVAFLHLVVRRISFFTDTLPHAANPYGATTIRASPTRVTHSPLASNPFSGLMLPELLALTGNFESTALHSEPSYSLYMVPPVHPDSTSYRLKGGYSSFELKRHMVESEGNAPSSKPYQGLVLLLYYDSIW